MIELTIADSQKVAALESEIADLRQIIGMYRSSTSWRITAPLRAIVTASKFRSQPSSSVPAITTGAEAGRESIQVPATPAPVIPSALPVAPEVSFSEEQMASGTYWDSILAKAPDILPRTAWWNDPPTLRHINRVACGEPIEGAHAGFNIRLGRYLQERSIARPRAISVGSGNGGKELAVLHAGIVGSFDCYEVGIGAIEAGRRMAAEQGMSERLRFHHADAFTVDVAADYDLVYWNNALHHMADTRAAIRWSWDRLRPGGVFAMDDYVGASRFQHMPEMVAWSNRMLALLPNRLLRRWDDPARSIPNTAYVPDPAAIAAIDPTEAVDSGNILPGLRATFADAEIISTGGALYFVALNDAFHNFVSEEDLRLLDALLLLDEAVARQGETSYAVAFATRK